MNEKKIPYLVENKERDTFTFYIKGTKPYLDLVKQISQLTNNWNELEEWINYQLNTMTMHIYMMQTYQAVLNKMKQIKERNNVSSRD